MRAGLQLNGTIRFSYPYLETGQQDLTVVMSKPQQSQILPSALCS